VPPEHRNDHVPCHQIPLNEAGDTLEDLELRDNQSKMETSVRQWLRAAIERIEKERASQQLPGTPDS
jgi:hypothetical protein